MWTTDAIFILGEMGRPLLSPRDIEFPGHRWILHKQRISHAPGSVSVDVVFSQQ